MKNREKDTNTHGNIGSKKSRSNRGMRITRQMGWILAIFWTLVVGASFTWGYLQERHSARHAAAEAARAQFLKDVIYRRWNSRYGGVYVPVTETSPPNPYLAHVPERDLVTPSGRRLTLINPAYMTRQVHRLGKETEGVSGHITSLKPIRPGNAPDDWEKRAMSLFEQGVTEYFTIENMNGVPHLRFMRPLITENACLKCHSRQGYREGDVRGGISVSMPMAPYLAISQRTITIMTIGHCVIWLLGLLGIGLAVRRIGKHITNHDKTATALREAWELLDTAIAQSPVGILIADAPDVTIRMANAAAFGIRGGNRKLLTGIDMTKHSKNWRISKPDGSVFSPGDLPLSHAILKGEIVPDMEIIIKDEAERDHAIICNAAPIRNEEGDVTAGIVILHDITHRKKAEEKLKALNRQLEIETTRANEMAENAKAASIAKSEFLANMSHEIRTPMNGLIGMTGLLLETELTEEQRSYAETARSSGKSLLGLLNDILDFSKIEAGKLKLESLDFNLETLMEDLAEMMAFKAYEKGVAFLCAVAPRTPVNLKGDSGRLRQVLANLAGNALKFTEKGEIVMRVHLESETESDVVIHFSVQDTGIGIPFEKQENLFLQFTQVDASITRKYGGTGLGLAISKQLVEAMGGVIGVNSQEGYGSEFWFTARFTKREAVKTEAPQKVDVRGIRVLVVDSNETHRDILSARFNDWSIRPDNAPDGETALRFLHEALLEDDPYKVAIIDMQLPDTDGEALGKSIKDNEALSDTGLIMMTAPGRREAVRRLGKMGLAFYLTKPMRRADLLETLTAVLLGERPKPRRAAGTLQSILALKQSSVRILLAEDNFTNQQVAVATINKVGLPVDAVDNGLEAIRALESTHYDMVIMDVQMPEMDGITATQRIRNSNLKNRDLPIIALTAHAMQGDREKFLEAGMDDYLCKPITPQDLAEMLKKWLPDVSDNSIDNDSKKTTGKEIKSSAQIAEPPPPLPISKYPRWREADGTDLSVFNGEAFMDRMSGDEDLAEGILVAYISDMPTQIDILKGCLKAGDAPNAARRAHTIKGAAACICADSLMAEAAAAETAAREGDLTKAGEKTNQMEKQFERLKDTVNGMLLKQ